MRSTPFWLVFLSACVTVTSLAGADPSDTTDSTDTTASDNSPNPYTQYDADGIPISIMHPHASQPSAAYVDAMRKQQQQENLDRNWLLRGYEQQLKSRAAANSADDQDTNLYYELSSNKELAKLAGLPDLGTDDDSTSPYRAGGVRSPSSLALRSDSTSAGSRPGHGNFFRPLITPLSAPDAAGLHNFYTSQPYAMQSPFANILPKATPAPKANPGQDSDLETPGLVSTDKNSDADSADLSLDILPGESVEEAKARQQDSSSLLQLPLPADADQLHKEQALAFKGPSAANGSPQKASPPVKVVPIEDPEAPIPVSKEPQINPVRSPIANPYDILNR